MLARNVEIVLNVITIPVGFFNNILSIFSELGIELEAIIPEAVAKASIYLDSETKKAGAMLLDIGWSKTKAAVFKDGILKNSIIFESGFDNIFKRIQEIYHLDDAEADRVLNEVMITEKESIMLQSEDGLKKVSVVNVRQIIDRGFKESLYSIKKSMDSKDISHLFAKGVCITGGSILKYPDLKDIATAILKQPVVVKDDKALSLPPDYAAAAGMLDYLFEKEASSGRGCKGSLLKRSFGRVYQFFDKYF